MTSLVIYQQVLDGVSHAVLSGDFATYVLFIDLPYLVHTTSTSIVLADADALSPVFHAVSRALSLRGVTHYERLAREAERTRPDRIDGWHFTHMIADGVRIREPHAVRQVLVLRDGTWRFSEASYPLLTADWPPTEDVVLDALAPGIVPPLAPWSMAATRADLQ